MYKLLNLLFLFLFSTMSAQIHEIGLFAGGSNYVGDVGSTNYIAPNEPAFGIIYKWNKSPRHSYRISYIQSNISANDLDSNEPSRNQRGYKFENNIKELSLGLEFNFFDFNLHDIKTKITPYVASGLSFFLYDELYLAPGETIEKTKTSSNAGIPIIVGIKSNISPSLVLGLEAGARYTFTDNLDGSNPKDDKLIKFGNINNNDWYFFSGLTLTYTFGNKPCYCAAQ